MSSSARSRGSVARVRGGSRAVARATVTRARETLVRARALFVRARVVFVRARDFARAMVDVYLPVSTGISPLSPGISLYLVGSLSRAPLHARTRVFSIEKTFVAHGQSPRGGPEAEPPPRTLSLLNFDIYIVTAHYLKYFSSTCLRGRHPHRSPITSRQ